MMLREELRRRLLEDRGIQHGGRDKCGKLLGSVRYNRRDEPGEYCSRESWRQRARGDPEGRPAKEVSNCRASSHGRDGITASSSQQS